MDVKTVNSASYWRILGRAASSTFDWIIFSPLVGEK